MNIDLASIAQAQGVVLVEGMSDKAALEALPSGAAGCPAAGASPSLRWAVRPTRAASWIWWVRTGSASG